MKFLLILVPLTAAQWTFSGIVDQPPCLDTAESALIALRWLQIFQTNSNGTGTGSALVATTLASNFTYFDEGASLGNPAAVYNSSAEVYQSVTSSGYSGNLVTDVQYSVISTFASCDISVVRWQSDSKSANATGVTVPVGTRIQYRGTDYLQVDLATRLIYNATSSSDLVNYYNQLGDDVIKSQRR